MSEILEKKLEKRLQDRTAEPLSLPLEFLEVITCDFSTERELGRGAYGVVYKGVLQSGKVIAVKKIFDKHLLDNNNKFENEIACLMDVRHQNVIRLVGYCVVTRSDPTKLPGQGHVMVQTPACLLCFEFHCKGSLDKYVSDDFSVLNWDMRYEIIMGVCRGLHYLHDKCHIVHLDLKPQNILMDGRMMPKIADFGLSRLLGEHKSKTFTTNIAGTLGYMAREYIDQGIISSKADIFSLGVIIIEIITGRRDYPNISETTETSLKHYTDEVVGSWRKRFAEITPMHMSPEMHIQQVEKCISIALMCLQPESKKRPTSLDIVQGLDALEPESGSPGNSPSDPEKNSEVRILDALTAAGARSGASRRDHFLKATVTFRFGETFALPGGYRDDDGTPMRAARYAFDACLKANKLAFIFSVATLICYVCGGSPWFNLTSRKLHTTVTLNLLEGSTTCLIATVALGVFVTLSPFAPKTARAMSGILLVIFKFAVNWPRWIILLRSYCVRFGPLLRTASGYTGLAIMNLFYECWPLLLIFLWAAYGRTHPNTKVGPRARPPSV